MDGGTKAIVTRDSFQKKKAGKPAFRIPPVNTNIKREGKVSVSLLIFPRVWFVG